MMLELYCRDAEMRNPGRLSSRRKIIDKPNPIEPPINPEIIYVSPIIMWLVVQLIFI